MNMQITLETPILDTPRVQQVRGMFDLAPATCSRLEWNVTLPLDAKPWHIGLIVGPSGCGKTTIARHLFGDSLPSPLRVRVAGGEGDDLSLAPPLTPNPSPPRGEGGTESIIDLFPDAMSIHDIVALLSAVGFASPPAWLRPFHVLSTGQQFRVSLALLLARTSAGERIVFDEYTSVVDRTVAQIGSAALAKIVRQRGQQFVAVTCHEDVETWLQPDWIYRPAENLFSWRRLRRRPAIALDIVRASASAWPLFAPHHYLSHAIAKSAVCFLASWRDQPVAFSAWLPFVGTGPRTRREHRTVTLPDFQGVGIGNALSDFVASLWTGLGYRAISTTTHPAMIRARLRSPNWEMRRRPSFARGVSGRLRHAATRLTAGFRYIGPALPYAAAKALLEA